MRFSPFLFLGVLAVVTTSTFAVPLAIYPQLLAQQSASEPSNETVNDEFPASRRGNRRAEVLQKLNLTRSQFKQLMAIRRQYQPLIREHSRTARVAQRELRNLLASSATESEVKAKFQQVQQHRQELQNLRFKSVLAMREILTPAQRQTYEEELERRRSLRRNRSPLNP